MLEHLFFIWSLHRNVHNHSYAMHSLKLIKTGDYSYTDKNRFKMRWFQTYKASRHTLSLSLADQVNRWFFSDWPLRLDRIGVIYEEIQAIRL